MKKQRRLDPEVKREARRLRQRLVSEAVTNGSANKSSLYDLWLGDLAKLAGNVAPAARPGLLGG